MGTFRPFDSGNFRRRPLGGIGKPLPYGKTFGAVLGLKIVTLQYKKYNGT
jgi:hypothetical protein